LLDENLDGLVSLQELMATWKRSAAESAGAVAVPPESELRQLFAQADQGKDGYLNDEEFFALCEAVYPTGVEKVEK
jgi:Ca2+-binding EF-hand superfamily protein